MKYLIVKIWNGTREKETTENVACILLIMIRRRCQRYLLYKVGQSFSAQIHEFREKAHRCPPIEASCQMRFEAAADKACAYMFVPVCGWLTFQLGHELLQPLWQANEQYRHLSLHKTIWHTLHNILSDPSWVNRLSVRQQQLWVEVLYSKKGV